MAGVSSRIPWLSSGLVGGVRAKAGRGRRFRDLRVGPRVFSLRLGAAVRAPENAPLLSLRVSGGYRWSWAGSFIHDFRGWSGV